MTGSTTEERERTLVVRAKAGNEAAFAALVRGNMQKVYRSAYAITHNGDDAADIAQETFIRAFRNLARFDETRPFFPWLYRIARNLCINRIQRITRRETSLPEYDIVADSHEGPEAAVVGADEKIRVRDAVDRLPEQHRRIIELNHFQELSYREIAEILDIPIGTVMSRLFHARKKLRELLESEGGHDDVK